jgi:Rps23 Pro-64 3,4-dihydroxylase Tpa1-like proline 4-hydroxylase
MNIEKYKQCVNFLLEKNCHNIIHSDSNFLEHLIGTFNILKKWKQSEDVCFAGMFHNVYGNKYFNPNLDITRETIRSLIGESAENLVFNYANYGEGNVENLELNTIRLANSLDQKRLFIVEDNLYDANSSKEIFEYFKLSNWNFDGSNGTDISLKWNYYLNYRHDIEKQLLNQSNSLLKKYNLNNVFSLKRSYASANTYGYSGEYHVDDGAKEYNEVVTIMFYLNDTWNFDFGGETFFLNNEKTEIEHAVIPKPARAVIFDGFIKHGPRPLSKVCKDMRIVLTFKYGLINET